MTSRCEIGRPCAAGGEHGGEATGLEHLMAFTPGADAGMGAEERAGQHRHGIGQVADPGLRCMGGDGAADLEHRRDRAQRAHEAAGADRVADRLADAVAGGNVDVMAHVLEGDGQDRDDHHVGAVERLGERGGGAVAHRGAGLGGDAVADRGVARGGGEVRHQLRRPVERTASDIGDGDIQGCFGIIHVVTRGDGGKMLSQPRKRGSVSLSSFVSGRLVRLRGRILRFRTMNQSPGREN